MKIVALLGSPRPEGNTAVLARSFLNACQSQGAAVETHFLNKMSYRGCQACMSCKTKTEACILEDDMTPVYEAIRQADIVVLVSPVYFGDLSGQLKTAFDRFYAYLDPNFASRLPAGKQGVFILTQGSPKEEEYNDIFGRYAGFLQWLNFQQCHLIRACGLMGPGEVKDRPEALQQAVDVAQAVMARP
ncbi:MAG: flavodoxin family protein [Deltaproteobacteria bacterium]|nr:flavodoxin family protein [Deltaproteobacteria bacterium]